MRTRLSIGLPEHSLAITPALLRILEVNENAVAPSFSMCRKFAGAARPYVSEGLDTACDA